MTKNQANFIGIDLGTTNSEVAVVIDGKPIVLKVEHSKLLPSVVSLSGQEVLVGQTAVNNELAAPHNTIRHIKRKMGRDELIALGSENYTPEMISSFILKKLKLAAEEFLGHPVTQAVITVPAFFNEKQRQATHEAAVLAGLEPLRLLNEPTAAAIVYSLKSKKQEKCLIYDLGGGTFDVSIVDFSSDMMEVRASHGDTELGGSDFDKMIANKIREAFQKEHGIDLHDDVTSWLRLLAASEKAKKTLTTEANAKILEEFIAQKEGQSLHIDFTLSRPAFEEMIKPSIEKTLVSVDEALRMANLKPEEIDRVILVGGSTMIPVVAQMLQTHLGIVPQAWVNPSTVVAMGAAVEAARLQGDEIAPLMVDVTPHSLGTSVVSDLGLENIILIPRGTPLPHTASMVFHKIYRGQKRVRVDALQGESSIPSANELLGEFFLEDLESDEMEILIKFELDKSGILHVTTTEVGSTKVATKTLKRKSSTRHKREGLADIESVRVAIDRKEAQADEKEADLDDAERWDLAHESQEIADEELVEADGIDRDLEDMLARVEELCGCDEVSQEAKLKFEQLVARIQEGDEEAKEELREEIYFIS